MAKRFSLSRVFIWVMIEVIGGSTYISNLGEFLKKIGDISSRYNITVQAVDADLVAGERHLRFAAEKAAQAFERGENLAMDLGVEILLYASGNRQINQALTMGVHEGENRVALVAVGPVTTDAMDDLRALVHEEPVVQYTPEKNQRLFDFFNITPLEVEAVGESKVPLLVLERVALLNVSK